MKCSSIQLVLVVSSLSMILLVSNALSLLGGEVTIGSSGKITTLSPLHVEGRYIKNAMGQIIHLIGVDKHGFEDGPGGNWIDKNGYVYWSVFKESVVKDNLNAMRSWGLNYLRIFLTCEGWKTGQYQQNIKDLLRWSGELGIYVMAGFGDVKFYYAGYSQGPYPWPPYTNYTDIISSKQDFINLYGDFAYTLKGFPNIIFEIYGELGGGTGRQTLPEWFDVVQGCIDAVRATGADQLIDIGWGWGIDTASQNTLDYLDPTSGFDVPSDPLGKLMYDTHIYRSGGGTGGEYTYDGIKAFWQQKLLDYIVFNLSKPFMVGEIGFNTWSTNLDEEVMAFQNQLRILNEWGINYAAWWWWSSGQYRLFSDPGYIPNVAGQVLINATISG